jgi:hypothetical protein
MASLRGTTASTSTKRKSYQRSYHLASYRAFNASGISGNGCARQ